MKMVVLDERQDITILKLVYFQGFAYCKEGERIREQQYLCAIQYWGRASNLKTEDAEIWLDVIPLDSTAWCQ